MSRTGAWAYALLVGYYVGGGNDAHSTLAASSDDGAGWIRVGEGCPQISRYEVDAAAVAASPGGVVALLCRPRFGNGDDFVALSLDGGEHFKATAGRIADTGGLRPASAVSLVGGVGRTFTASVDATIYRSTDNGASWVPVPQLKNVTFLGFESNAVGRAVGLSRRVVWTTTDAGASWSSTAFTD